MIADPHCHTLSSDGMVTPRELVAAAVAAHLDLIAVTDHDTMESVREAQTGLESGAYLGKHVVVLDWGAAFNRRTRKGGSRDERKEAVGDGTGAGSEPAGGQAGGPLRPRMGGLRGPRQDTWRALASAHPVEQRGHH